jgi:hypothetical protein
LVTEDGTGPITAYVVGLGLTAVLWIAGLVVERIAYARLVVRPELSGIHRVRVAATMRTLSAFNEPARAALRRLGFEPMLVRYELGRRSRA